MKKSKIEYCEKELNTKENSSLYGFSSEFLRNGQNSYCIIKKLNQVEFTTSCGNCGEFEKINLSLDELKYLIKRLEK
jgi:hypothetical protein